MEDKPAKPGYAALRRYRGSRPQAEYFLTINLKQRGGGFESSQWLEVVRSHWQELEQEGHWVVRTAVIMPDHIHLLVRLGEGGPLTECVRLFKGRLSSWLRTAGLQWQPGFFDHQLRRSEDARPVFLYIYLNPYRAGLMPMDRVWPGYFCAKEDWGWFRDLTNESMPQPEWLE